VLISGGVVSCLAWGLRLSIGMETRINHIGGRHGHGGANDSPSFLSSATGKGVSTMAHSIEFIGKGLINLTVVLGICVMGSSLAMVFAYLISEIIRQSHGGIV